MKLLLRCLPLLLILSCTLPALASVKPAKKSTAVELFYKHFPGLKKVSLDQLLSLSPREYEKATGNKLKWKEKIVYRIVKAKMKKKLQTDPTAKQRTLGVLSLVFGLLAIGFIFIPAGIGLLGILFAIAGFVLGLKSLKGNSNAPGLIGLILSSAVLLLLIIAVIVVASWDWY